MVTMSVIGLEEKKNSTRKAQQQQKIYIKMKQNESH